MDPKLSPCPFCGETIDPDSEESWQFGGGGPPPRYSVRCYSCGAEGPYGHGKIRNDHAGAQQDAALLWNKAQRPSAIEDVRRLQNEVSDLRGFIEGMKAHVLGAAKMYGASVSASERQI
jgi:hypothetical protein